MSAPLRLSSDDLRHLANGLDALSKTKRDHGVGPSIYDSNVSLETEDDTITLRVMWVPSDTDLDQYVIDDRYGS